MTERIGDARCTVAGSWPRSAIDLYMALLVYNPLQPNAIAEPKSRPNAEYIYGVIGNTMGALITESTA